MNLTFHNQQVKVGTEATSIFKHFSVKEDSGKFLKVATD